MDDADNDRKFSAVRLFCLAFLSHSLIVDEGARSFFEMAEVVTPASLRRIASITISVLYFIKFPLKTVG